METTVMAPARFTTRVGEGEAGRVWAWSLTVALHRFVAAAVVIVPLLGEESLPSENAAVARAFFAAPALAPAPPPPPPPPSVVRPATAPRVAPKDTSSTFTAPVDVPETILAEAGMDIGVEGGVPGGVEGGVPGGVVGGVVGGLDDGAAAAAASRPGRRDHSRAAEGQARLPCLPEHRDRGEDRGRRDPGVHDQPAGPGRGCSALRGVPALDDAAVEAVRQWVYTPTLLGGVPVAVVMTVTVHFVLRRGGVVLRPDAAHPARPYSCRSAHGRVGAGGPQGGDEAGEEGDRPRGPRATAA